MRHTPSNFLRRSVGVGLFCLIELSFCLLNTNAHAGLTFTLDILRYNHGNNYRFYTPLATNSIAPAAPLGMYFISSPFYSPTQNTNGSWRQMEVTAGGVNTLDGRENGYDDYNSVMQQITNGTWTILFTNATTTNLYTFTVSAPNMTSNMLPATIITFPSEGALNISNQPAVAWQGPTSWPVKGDAFLYDYYANNYGYRFIEYASLPAAQSSWTSPSPIPNGFNCTFQINFLTNNTMPIFAATVPLSTNVSHSPISGWSSNSILETGDDVRFAVTNPPATGISLVAHYTFDNSGNLGRDTSGNGYDLNYNGGNGVTSSGTTAAGSGAASFDGGSFFSYTSTPSNVLSTLAGDFTVSFWIKTSQNNGNENGPAYAGAGILTADVPGSQYYDLVPAALDGGQIGFNTGHYDDTLNSTTDINDGSYHHIAITRKQSTGEKKVYIDGSLNNTQIATLNPLSDPRLVAVGCQIDASQPDPTTANTADFFNGLLDDIQIYSGVLSAGAIAQLHSNPGSIAAVSGGAHTLIAYYAFNDSGNEGLDSTANGNNINCSSSWGPGHASTGDAIAGGGALQFFGGSSLTPCGQAFTSWTNTLAGSFSVSAWIKTTSVVGNDDDDLSEGSGQSIIYADNNNLGATPVALTGSKVAFRTTDPDGNDDTLHSLASVTTGNYVHIVSTRDQSTGEKKIYINGVLDNSNFASTEPLTGAQYVSIGGELFSAYTGLVDDVQIYSGVLSGSDVDYLYQHPGSYVPNTTSQDFNAALNTTGLPWATGGDAGWFVEATNSQDGVSAAQSGSVTGNQASTLSVTVNGPGTLDFYWSSFAQDPSGGFDYEFYIDNPNSGDVADLYGDNPWQSIQQLVGGPVHIPAGQHTLFWSVYPYGDTDPTQAGYLDLVNYVPDTMPVITLNPFSQTNYSGYPVWLAANATGNPAATWQWFKVGFGAIPGATTASLIPTNSGTAGVAGSYYAVASNDAGSAFTATAAVSFVSAPLPPDWSRAVKSPFAAGFGTNVIRDYYTGCAVDAAGEVYVADQYVGAVNVQSNFVVLNTLTSVGNYGAAALAKHAPDGRPIWVVGLTNNQPSSYSYGVCAALAPGNGAYLASVLIGTNWLGTNQFANNGGDSVLLSRFDANGSNIWSRLIGQSNQVFCLYNTLVSDADGNVTVAGVINGTADFGGTNLTASSYMGFLAQYSANGGLLWAQLIPGFPQNLAYSAGRIYFSTVAVNSGGVTNLSVGSMSNLTDRAYGLVAINATNGQALWLHGLGEQYGAKTNGGFSDDIPLVSASGTDVFVTGTAYGSTALFGGLSVPLPGGRYQYFARYDTNGNAQVATNFGSATTMPWASAANSSGVYISGDFDSFAYFGNLLVAAPVYTQNYLGANYFTQPFLAKFDRNGNPVWARNGVSSLQANFRGLATSSDGVWASGISLVSDIFHPAQFGTNTVYSDNYLYNFGTGVTALFTEGGLLTKVTESASATPVTLINPHAVGANFQFQFLSAAGFNHNILYRTNLAVGNWQTNSTVGGDGTVKTISLPFNLFSPAKQGFIRVTTQ